MSKSIVITDETVVRKIHLIRGRRVMMDRDLAKMYGVETRMLNQAVKRNEKRFPQDFMFQFTDKELIEWKSQVQITVKEKMGLRKFPLVFSEQGIAMLSSVLNSETVIEVNIGIIRVFTRMREMLFTHKDISLKLEQLEKQLLQQDGQLKKQEGEMQMIFTALKELLNPNAEPLRKIGFKRKGED